MKKIKQLINIIKKINLEEQSIKYIPFLKYIFKIRNFLFSYEIHEKNIFINNMPKWYSIYE